MPRSPAGFNGSMRSRALLLLALLATAACSAPRPSLPPPASPSSSAALPPARADAFREALTDLAAHDAASDWTDATCTELAARFATLFDPPRAAALQNAAVVETRCDHDSAALE